MYTSLVIEQKAAPLDIKVSSLPTICIIKGFLKNADSDDKYNSHRMSSSNFN
jgi:hypothetical protein